MTYFKPLRMLLLEKDMQQYQLAQAAGMSDATLSSRLYNKHPFDAWEMDKIAKVLGIRREDYHKYFFERHCNLVQEALKGAQ